MMSDIFNRFLQWRPVTRRGRSIVLSMLTSSASKGVSIVAQLVAYPIAVRSLKPETFSSFIMLSSILAWFSLSSVGIGPSLIRSISLAALSERRDQETVIFSTALWLAFGTVGLLLGLFALAVLGGIVRPAALLGIPTADSDATLAIILASVLVALGVITSVTEGARSGYLEQFTTNFWNGVGSALSLVAMLLVAWLAPTLTAMCLAVFGTVLLAKLANTFALIGIQRRYLFPLPRYFHWKMVSELMNSSAAFLIIQLSSLFVIEAPTLIIGWTHSAAAATPFTVLLRLEFLLTTGLTMISVPLWPAINDAHVRGEREWILRITRRFLAFSLLYSVPIGLALAFFGGATVHLWLGRVMNIPLGLQIAMGAFFPIWLSQHAIYTILIGLGKIWQAALSLCAWSGFILLLGIPFTSFFGGVGMAVALDVSALVCLPIFGFFLFQALNLATNTSDNLSDNSLSGTP